MPTTPNGAPYPTGASANDIPGDLQALAEWTDEALGSAGGSGRGYSVPAGSLDTWKAARDNAAAELVEIAVFGDSTTYGSCFDAPGTHGVYSWTQKLRALLADAGLPDGGRGVVSINDNADINPDGYNGIFANTGFAGGSNQGPLLTDTPQSATNGNVITFKGKGTAIRLLYGIQGTSGGFSYAVDGGAAVNVEPVAPVSGFGGDALIVSGLTEGDHTVAVTNLGGKLLDGPPIQLDQGNGAGSIPAGTYYWRATIVTGSGETLPGPAFGPITMDGSHGRYFFMGDMSGYSQIKLYRSTNSTTGFKLVNTSTAVFNMQILEGSATSTTDAPTVSTAGRDTAKKFVSVTAQFLRATGIVVNKYGVSGITTGTYFAPTTGVPGGSWQSQLALGQVPDLVSAESVSIPYSWAQPEGAHPKYPRVRLAICALGINDQQSCANLTDAKAAVVGLQNNLASFIRQARSAGADPLIVIPHYNIAQGGDQYGGMFQAAHRAIADAYSCAMVDFNEALGPVGEYAANGVHAAVHANVVAYDLEAQFLWDNALSKGLVAML